MAAIGGVQRLATNSDDLVREVDRPRKQADERASKSWLRRPCAPHAIWPVAVLLATLAAGGGAWAADAPVACPDRPIAVVRSRGGTLEYKGVVDGLPELCRLTRADGEGAFYFGLWRTDWPGAGQAYPALHAVVLGSKGTRVDFVTRALPGWQWKDSLVNEGREPLTIDGRTYQTLRMSHERNGIEGNTYHSIITSWRDVATGVSLKVIETQISGQSYGPDTTWTASRVEPR